MPGSPDMCKNIFNHVALGHALTMMGACDKYLKDVDKQSDREDIIKTEIFTRNRESTLVEALLLRGHDNTCLAEVRRCW